MRSKPESTVLCRACARFCSSLPLHALPVQCRPSDGQAAMSATYFISCGTKSAKRAENPCPSRKHLASTAIYRLYTFCCQFARGFFRISDKKFFCKIFRCLWPRLLRFSTVKMKLFHQKLSQLHKRHLPAAKKPPGTQHFCTLRAARTLSYGVDYLRLKVSGSKSGSSQKRVMISVRSFRIAFECSK